jgi:hypothetical protein
MNATKNYTLITGNTYPFRKSLADLGGKWNAKEKGWEVPDVNAETARQLVSGSSPVKNRYEDRYVSNIYQVGNTELFRNKKGRCEDAPCCGCCNF